jgi:hypothetical protein
MARFRTCAAAIGLMTVLPVLTGCHTTDASYRDASTLRNADQSRQDERQREQTSAMNDMMRSQQHIPSFAH